MKIPDYEIIEELTGNDWQVLYRARRRADGRPVLIKASRRQPPEADLGWLGRELDLLRDLSMPGLLCPIEQLPMERGSGLVLEDPGARPLARLPIAGAVREA